MTNQPLLCATVTAATMAELRQRRDEAAATADLVELRLDTVRDPEVAGALAGRRTPVIVTVRSSAEGGAFAGSEHDRRRLLAEALARGAEYVDLEWRSRLDDLIAVTSGRRVVLSFHDFNGIPDDLPAIARAMRATGAEVIKIAVTASRLSDCVALLDLAQSPACKTGSVLIAMGPAGLSTRVLASRFGCAWTYAGVLSDVGQITTGELLEQYRFRSISGQTELFGLTGSPIGHSVSPAMHNAALRAADVDGVYLPLPATDADDFMTFARAMRVKGASVTIPFKVSLFDRVDDVDPLARRIGAINTIRADAGRWIGRNTDVAGFIQPLVDRGIALGGTRVSVLGAGGSARAVVVGLAAAGADITVHARDRRKAEAVATLASAGVGAWPPPAGSWDLLVNCTPVGMHPRVEQTPLPADRLTGTCVYDLVYNPMVTRLLREAAAAGCQTIGGLEMLVAQAHEQFHWWIGAPPAAGVMRAAALSRLSEFTNHEDHVV